MVSAKAVIFDLFGTLVELTRNSRPYWSLCRPTRSVELMRQSLVLDAPTLRDFCALSSLTPPDSVDDLQSELDLDVAGIRLFHDSLDVLQLLKRSGIKTALVSNLASPYRRCVADLGLAGFLDVVVFSCEVGLVKPQPAIYELALQQLGVTSSHCLMVGDSQRCDVAGPAVVGIRGLQLRRRGGGAVGDAVQSLTEVPRFLDVC